MTDAKKPQSATLAIHVNRYYSDSYDGENCVGELWKRVRMDAKLAVKRGDCFSDGMRLYSDAAGAAHAGDTAGAGVGGLTPPHASLL